jgi:Phytanoyl-CoA dioxygenase (PhyH)
MNYERLWVGGRFLMRDSFERKPGFLTSRASACGTTNNMADHLTQIDRDGFALIGDVYSSSEMRDTIERLSTCLNDLPSSSAALRSRNGKVYALRNALDLFPFATTLWQREPLTTLLTEVLGARAGLVRGLFFDKPPERSWSLPWHKDLTIAVRDNAHKSTSFRNPTCKAGIPHVEAPVELLNRMLTLRIHLDDANETNGALRVIPGSHRDSNTTADSTSVGKLIEANAGDVLAMRPLLSHCSGTSHPNTLQHRRIIHLEFAADRKLLDGFEWQHFVNE